VVGDETVYCKGFGVRGLDSTDPVDTNTIYRLASNTKAFTAFSLGLLVDEGKLEWDKPIKNYIPDFKLYNDYLTESVTVRDLLCHRTGLPAHDWALHDPSLTRKDCVERLRYLEPNFDLRVKHQYNNKMFMLAAYVLECITGEVWEHFVMRRIFEPLEMNNTIFHCTGRAKPGISRRIIYCTRAGSMKGKWNSRPTTTRINTTRAGRQAPSTHAPTT